MKRIALALAFAVMGITSVASGTIVARTFAGSDGSAAVDITHETLAANCWLVTGATKNAGCSTSATDPTLPGLADLPALPDLPVDVPQASDLVPSVPDISDLPDAGDLAELADLPIPPVPSACSTALGVSAPLPTATFAAGMSLIDSLTAFAQSQLHPPALPVALPSLPVDAPAVPDVIGAVTSEAGCLASASGSSPVPSLCDVAAGVPVITLPAGPLSGLLSSVVRDVADLTGQSVSVTSGNSVGVTCTTNPELALPSAPALPSVPSITVPSIPSVPNPAVAVPTLPATPQVTVPTIPSLPVTVPAAPAITVPDLSNLTESVPALLPVVSCQASGSGSVSSGLLGSLTSTLSGNC